MRFVVGGFEDDPHLLVADEQARGDKPFAGAQFHDQRLAGGGKAASSFRVEMPLGVVGGDGGAFLAFPAGRFQLAVAGEGIDQFGGSVMTVTESGPADSSARRW